MEIITTKRTNLEITAEIPSFCKQPQTKTHVMYNTNLSWQMLPKIFPNYNHGGSCRFTTAKPNTQQPRKDSNSSRNGEN